MTCCFVLLSLKNYSVSCKKPDRAHSSWFCCHLASDPVGPGHIVLEHIKDEISEIFSRSFCQIMPPPSHPHLWWCLVLETVQEFTCLQLVQSNQEAILHTVKGCTIRVSRNKMLDSSRIRKKIE